MREPSRPSRLRRNAGPVTLTVRSASLDDVFDDMVRVHQSHRPFSRAGEVIAIRCGNRRIAAVARGAKGNDNQTITLDLRLRQKLDIKPNQSAEFSFEPASLLDQLCWAWNATDAMPRVGARLAVLSVALGAVGLALGVISLVVALR